MIRRPPRATRTDTLFPYTTRFRSFIVRFGHPYRGWCTPAAAVLPRSMRRGPCGVNWCDARSACNECSTGESILRESDDVPEPLEITAYTVSAGAPDLRPGSRQRQWMDDTPRSEEHTSELQSIMRISYAVF